MNHHRHSAVGGGDAQLVADGSILTAQVRRHIGAGSSEMVLSNEAAQFFKRMTMLDGLEPDRAGALGRVKAWFDQLRAIDRTTIARIVARVNAARPTSQPSPFTDGSFVSDMAPGCRDCLEFVYDLFAGITTVWMAAQHHEHVAPVAYPELVRALTPFEARAGDRSALVAVGRILKSKEHRACRVCHQLGHIASECRANRPTPVTVGPPLPVGGPPLNPPLKPQSAGPTAARVQCHRCANYGHIAKFCPHAQRATANPRRELAPPGAGKRTERSAATAIVDAPRSLSTSPAPPRDLQPVGY